MGAANAATAATGLTISLAVIVVLLFDNFCILGR